MSFRLTKEHLKIYHADRELMAVAEADIRTAHGELVERCTPTAITLALYSEVIAQAEGKSNFDAEILDHEE